jgi:hypothetical protein
VLWAESHARGVSPRLLLRREEDGAGVGDEVDGLDVGSGVGSGVVAAIVGSGVEEVISLLFEGGSVTTSNLIVGSNVVAIGAGVGTFVSSLPLSEDGEVVSHSTPGEVVVANDGTPVVFLGSVVITPSISTESSVVPPPLLTGIIVGEVVTNAFSCPTTLLPPPPFIALIVSGTATATTTTNNPTKTIKPQINFLSLGCNALPCSTPLPRVLFSFVYVGFLQSALSASVSSNSSHGVPGDAAAIIATGGEV